MGRAYDMRHSSAMEASAISSEASMVLGRRPNRRAGDNGYRTRLAMKLLFDLNVCGFAEGYTTDET